MSPLFDMDNHYSRSQKMPKKSKSKEKAGKKKKVVLSAGLLLGGYLAAKKLGLLGDGEELASK